MTLNALLFVYLIPLAASLPASGSSYQATTAAGAAAADAAYKAAVATSGFPITCHAVVPLTSGTETRKKQIAATFHARLLYAINHPQEVLVRASLPQKWFPSDLVPTIMNYSKTCGYKQLDYEQATLNNPMPDRKRLISSLGDNKFLFYKYGGESYFEIFDAENNQVVASKDFEEWISEPLGGTILRRIDSIIPSKNNGLHTAFISISNHHTAPNTPEFAKCTFDNKLQLHSIMRRLNVEFAEQYKKLPSTVHPSHKFLIRDGKIYSINDNGSFNEQVIPIPARGQSGANTENPSSIFSPDGTLLAHISYDISKLTSFINIYAFDADHPERLSLLQPPLESPSNYSSGCLTHLCFSPNNLYLMAHGDHSIQTCIYSRSGTTQPFGSTLRFIDGRNPYFNPQSTVLAARVNNHIQLYDPETEQNLNSADFDDGNTRLELSDDYLVRNNFYGQSQFYQYDAPYTTLAALRKKTERRNHIRLQKFKTIIMAWQLISDYRKRTSSSAPTSWTSSLIQVLMGRRTNS